MILDIDVLLDEYHFGFSEDFYSIFVEKFMILINSALALSNCFWCILIANF